MNSLLNDIRAILFDLDNTIFDHTRVQKESLFELHTRYSEIFDGISFDKFYRAYVKNNEIVWRMMVAGEITKETLRLRRFSDVLQSFGLGTARAAEMTKVYLDIYADRYYFMDGAYSVLQELHTRFNLGLITNGFPDIQNIKIDRLGIRSLFDVIVMSDTAGVMKPHPDIFLKAVEALDRSAEECLFVGDSYDTDITGAAQIGMKTVWFNPSRKEPPQDAPHRLPVVTDLRELITQLEHSSSG